MYSIRTQIWRDIETPSLFREFGGHASTHSRGSKEARDSGEGED
jgi:hypothetical protein